MNGVQSRKNFGDTIIEIKVRKKYSVEVNEENKNNNMYVLY